MSVLDADIFGVPLVFVDVETNGLNHLRGRVIEVAAIRVEQGVIVETFNSLIDSETELPYFITNLTGITSDQVKKAPTFDQVADELHQMLAGAVFVAHNVRFDYSFLKQEFGRVGMTFLPRQLCTVKLSRSLFPHEKGHKLEDLIRRHGLHYTHRHRAYDDAAVLWQFMRYLPKHFPPEQINQAVVRQMKQPAIPKALEPELVKGLPETPGVYIFEDAEGQPIYIGKSVNIKQRVLSHFGRDHADSKEFKIAQAVAHITTHQTPGELSALLLESQLIKELHPIYNRRLRKLTQVILARQQTNEDGYKTVALETAEAIDPEKASNVLAIYPRRSRAHRSFEEAVRQYSLCPKLMGLEKSNGACFLYQLKKCRGACIGEETAVSYNSRLDIAFDRQRIKTWPYPGAVLIEERVVQADVSKALIVDQWCVLGELSQETDCSPIVTNQHRAFDLDTYKILQSFLSSKLSSLRVQLISREQLQAFTS